LIPNRISSEVACLAAGEDALREGGTREPAVSFLLAGASLPVVFGISAAGRVALVACCPLEGVESEWAKAEAPLVSASGAGGTFSTRVIAAATASGDADADADADADGDGDGDGDGDAAEAFVSVEAPADECTESDPTDCN
jgi:hypothetical protein